MVVYNMYVHNGVEDLRALQAFNVETQTWSSPHCELYETHSRMKYVKRLANSFERQTM